MNKLLFLVSCLFCVSICGAAQTVVSESPKSLSMVETERAFASLSKEKGTQPAFMAFIAEDGILFRPKAVKGKQWMSDHPAPVSNKRTLLSWGPSFAEVASAGDMGYTFGPWQFRSNISDERPVAWGHFVTVWKKQADSSWRFAVDLGVSHPEPTTTATSEVEQPKNKVEVRKGQINVDSERASLLSAEEKFSEDSSKNGARQAFTSRAASYVHVFRENRFPFSGIAASSEAIPAGAALWSWKPEGWDVSRSGDLGYSYGNYRLASTDSGTAPETGNYFRIWRKQGDMWKVVVDVANPVEEKKN